MARLTRSFPPAAPASSPLPAAPEAPRRAPARISPRRAALVAAVALAAAAAHLAGDDAASARAAAADPELAWLLRSMALTKGAVAAAAVWLADRLLLRAPLGAGLAAGLVSAVALMAAAPVLMWHVAHVGAGALLFHGGLLSLLVLGWRPTEAWLTERSRAGRAR